MSVFSLLALLAPSAFCCISYFISSRANIQEATERPSANSLVVLSGMLAALAILIPLGAGLLPNGKFAWHEWGLVGALIAGIICIFGTIYSMIRLQAPERFKPKDLLYVPGSINATWIALGVLSVGIVAVKLWQSSSGESLVPSKSTNQAQILVVRSLPELGMSKEAIEAALGSATYRTESALEYRTKDGIIVICLDAKAVAESIIETKENDENAIRNDCRSH